MGDCLGKDPEGSPYTIKPGSLQTVALGNQDCRLGIYFQNSASDCITLAQMKDPSGAAVGSTFRSDRYATVLQVHAGITIRRDGWGGQVVSSIEFEVTADCDAYFDGVISVSVADTQSRNHAGTVIAATLRSSWEFPQGL